MTAANDEDCPCGSGHAYPHCCGPLHDGATAPNSEAVMRSRYSAYVLKRAHYLLASWHASTRPAVLDLANDATRWLGLRIVAFREQDADHATVEFVARHRIAGGSALRLHEISRFVCEGGRWQYLDAAFRRLRASADPAAPTKTGADCSAPVSMQRGLRLT